MRRFWRALIALVVVGVFVALLMLNTSALAELAWASLAGRFGRRAQVIGVALLLLVVASLIVPFLRRDPEATEPAMPAAPASPPAQKPRVARKPVPPPADSPKRAPGPAAKRANRSRRVAKGAGGRAKGGGGKGGGSSKNPR